MYVVLVEFEIELSHFNNFKYRVLQQAKDSLDIETDCHVFDVCEDHAMHNQIVLYEHYSNKAAFDKHLESSHFKAFDTEVAPWILSKSVRILQTIDQAN
jgi:(4S)-4-hydroxy-5-phosphonooxypentane-2,3-dione isomerase